MNKAISAGVRLSRLVMPLCLACLVAALIVMAFPIWTTVPTRNLIDPALSGDAAVKALTGLTERQRATFQEREKKRLAAEPLDVSALNNLAVLESLAGNTKSAEAYALESASRTLRDTQSQVGALRLYLIRKDYVKAMYHLNGALVSDPELGNSVFPSVGSLLADDEATAQLAKTLNQNPTWRKDFLFWLNANDKNDQLTFKLFNQLRKQGGGATTSEILEYLRKLVAHKNYDRAYFVWLDSLDQTALLKVGNLFDGNFDLEAKNQYFDWNFYPFANGEIGIVPKRDDDKDRVLRLSFYNTTEPFANVEQYLRIRPGVYQFSGEETANSLKAVAGLKFVVYCAGSGAVLGQSPAVHDSNPWQKFSFEFTIPDDTCQTQLLRLQSASTAVLDAKMDGEILFDSLAIAAVEKEQAKTGN
jgi:hypothetical protein